MSIRNLTNTDTFGEWKDLTNEVIDFINDLGQIDSSGSGINFGSSTFFEELNSSHLAVNSTGIFVNSAIIPTENFTYDLGLPGFQFNDIYASYLISNSLGLFTSYFTSNSSYFTSNLSVVPATDGELELGSQTLGWNAVFLSNVSAVFFDVDTSGLTRIITRDDNSDSMYIGDNTGTGIFVNGTQVTVSSVNTVYMSGEFLYADARTIDVGYSTLSEDANTIAGIQIVQDNDYVGWLTTSEDGNSWEMVSPGKDGVIVFTPPVVGAAYFNMENFSGGSLNLDQGLSSNSNVTFNDLELTGNLTVGGIATFAGLLNASGEVNASSLTVQGSSTLKGGTTFEGAATFSGGATTISSDSIAISGTTTNFSGETISFGSGAQVNFNASGDNDVTFNSNISFGSASVLNGDIVIGRLRVDGTVPDPPAATLTMYGPSGFTGNVTVNGFLTLTQPLVIPPAEDGTPTIFEGDVEFWKSIRQPNTAIANLSSLEVWNDQFEHQIAGTVNVGSLLVEGSTTTKGSLTVQGSISGVTSLSMTGAISGTTKVTTDALDVNGDLSIKTPGVLNQTEQDSLNTLGGALLISNTVSANSTSEQMALEVIGGVVIRQDLYVNGAILGSIKPNPDSTDPAAFGAYGDGEAGLDPSAAATQISPTGTITLGLPPNAGAGRPSRKKRASISPEGAAEFITMGALDDDDPINGVTMNSSGYLFFGKANSTYFFGNNDYLEGFVNNGNLKLSTNNGDLVFETTNGSISFLSNTQFYSNTTVNTITVLGTLDVTDETTLNTLSVTKAATLSNTLSVTGTVTLSNTLSVTGSTTLNDTLSVTEAATLSNTLSVTGAVTLSNTLSVTGSTTLNDTLSNTLSVTGAATLANTLSVTGSTTLSDTLGVTGAATLANTLSVTGAATLAKTLDVTGAATLNTTSIVGATTVANTIEFNKLALFQDAFRANGSFIVEKNAEFSQDVTISGNLTVLGAQVTINAASLAVEDAIVVLNHGALDANTVLSQDAGFLIENAEDLGEALAVFYDKSEDRVCIAYTNSVHTDTTLVITKYANMHAGMVHGEELMSSNTLTVFGAATINTLSITGPLTLANTLNVTGATTLSKTLNVTRATTLSNTLSVTGATTLAKTLNVTGGTTLSNTLSVTGAVTLANTLNVTGTILLSGDTQLSSISTNGAATLANTLSVTGATTLANTLSVTGAATLSGTLGVTGAATLANTLGVTGAATLSDTLGVTGATTLSDTLGVTGATTLANTLGVTGAATLSDTLGVTGAATLSDTLGVTGATTLANTLSVTGQTTINDNLIVKHIIPVANIAYDLGTSALRFRDLYLSGTTLTLGGATLGATEEGGLTTGGGDFTVDGTITATGGLVVNTSSTLANTISVTGAATLANTLGVTGATTLSGTLGVTGAATLANTLGVTGATTLSGTLGVTGATTLANTLSVTGNTVLSSKLTVSGNQDVVGNLVVDGYISVNGASSFSNTLGITGATTLFNTLYVGKGATLTNTLSVTGATTLSNTLSVTGNTIISGKLDVTGQLTTSSTLSVIGNLSSNTLTTNSITISTIDVIPTVKTNKIYAIGQELWYNGDVLLIQEMSEPTTPATATASVNTTTGFLENITLDYGGQGYQSSPVIYIIGGGATDPARVTANVSSGNVTSLTIDDAGVGYSSTPDVVFVGGGSEPVTFGEGTFNIDNLVEGSSSKIKYNIESINNIDYNKFMSLNPVSYVKNSNNKKEVGFIAEEVFNLYPELVGFDRKGNISGLQYTRLIPYMIKVIQEQQNTIDGLKTKLEIKD